jgi:hypothetical protein
MKQTLLKKVLLITCVLTLAACKAKKEEETTDLPSTPPPIDNGGGTGGGSNNGSGDNNNSGGGSTTPGNGNGGNTNPGNGGGSTPDTSNPPADTCSPINGTVESVSVSLNDGALTTESSQVIFKFAGDEILKMKISDNDSCTCGTWEKFAESKVWTLKSANESNNLSVQFRDFEGRYTKCQKLSILHDNTDPVVKVQLDASNVYQSGKDTKLNLEVSDLGSGVQKISCTLNGLATNCAAGVSTITFTSQLAGAYTFAVTVLDGLGHSSQASVAWNVINSMKPVVQNHEIKSNNKVDILLIDDNSASMEYEQKSMAKRMATFLSVLKGLEWRIAITTTDPADGTWGDGRLLEMKGMGKQYYIGSDMEPKKAQKALEDTIQRTEMGNSSEQGIYATYRAIERSFDAKNPHAQFFRGEANFAAVVISDENESNNQMRNIPENLLSYVNQVWPTKNFAFHSIITKSGDTQCKSTNGYSYGTVYEKMSKLTGAGMVGGPIIGSVCAEDYGSQLTGIGDSVQAMQKMIDLDCPPLGNADSSVVVEYNGNNYTAPYLVQGTRMVFSSNLPVGKYVLQYNCKP